MRNIILFLLHFSIISHLKSIYSINTQISHNKFKKSNCFISNFNLYNSTLTNDLLSKKSNKKLIKSLESEEILKETENDTGILLESPTNALKSIVDKGSIKSSSIRHEILDKESILDELIVSKDNFKGISEDINNLETETDKNINYSPKKFEEVLKVLETSVLKKTVDKKEQVIKPSDKMLKRRSKETIYTRLQNYVKSSEPFLSKHGLVEEVKNFVHLFHWNVWHTGTLDGTRACNWTVCQFERFSNLMDKIDRIINDELKTFLDITTNTDQDLIGDVIEKRTNFVFSSHYVYNKIKELVELGEFDLYKDRMSHLYHMKCKIIKILKNTFSYLIFDPRETKLYNKIKMNLLDFKNYFKRIKNKVYSKLNKTKIFMNKFPLNKENRNKIIIKNHNKYNIKYEELDDIYFDKLNLKHLLKHLSHTYISPQILKLQNISREDLYKISQVGDWNLYFVGSGSRQPTNTRLTSTMALKKNNKGGPILLFDCGEGTKNGLEKLCLDPSQVQRVFLTHLHGDHCYGIFSFLYMRERSKPLEIYGPPGTRKLINAIHQNTSTSTYSLFKIHELLPKSKKDIVNSGTSETDSLGINNLGLVNTNNRLYNNNTGIDESVDIYINDEGYYSVFRDENVEIFAADLEHTMPTVGYVIQIRNSKDNKLKDNNNNLQNNQQQNKNNNTNDFESILNKNFSYLTGPKSKEIKKIAICQDSSDSSKMKKIAMNSDILIHEATLSSTSSLVSGILLDIIRDNSDLVLWKGSIKKLYNFLTNVETKLACFNFTLSALSSFVKCERYYLLQKLNIFKNFVSNFKILDKEFKDNNNNLQNNQQQNKNNNNVKVEDKNKKEIEKKLKEKWLNNVFIFMDRLTALNELNRNEYFIKRLQNRYNLMSKLSKVLPTLDMNKVLDITSRKLMFSKILKNHGGVNYAYERYDINNKYKDKFIVDVPKYLNSVSVDVFEYWNDILQLNLSSQSNSNIEDSIDNNWKLLYDKIIGSFGHSTPNMAGKFANEINAKKLILTHFSNKYPGDEKFENLLTMIRIENEARMGYSKNGSNKLIPIIAAWDKMKLRL